LLKKDKEFVFEEKELQCFEMLKKKLDEVELHTDASAQGFGAVLLHRKKDKKLHPIFYFSKATTNDEAKYHSLELETLAIIYALRRFRIYVQGRRFRIVKDCNSLTLTLNRIELKPLLHGGH